MPRVRISIGWMMLFVALVAFHLAIVCSYPPLFGLGNLEVGLLPGVTVGAVVLFVITGHRSHPKQPLGWIFFTCLVAAICGYLFLCLSVPDLVRRPVAYYINNIEPHLYDADLTIVYRLSLEIDGLILGVPQLLLATAGAAIIKAATDRRRQVVAAESA